MNITVRSLQDKIGRLNNENMGLGEEVRTAQ